MAGDVFGIVGTTQGAFKVERVVAEGGFGVVYRAYHEAFRAPVALKCLKVPAAMPEELRAQFLDKFREEAELLFRLSAAIPAVVRPLHHDVISTAAGVFVPFIALEWLDGDTLASHIAARAAMRQPPLAPGEAIRLLAPVARALEAAHRFPGPGGPTCVVHRDLKPANIFLAQIHGAEVVKILDFGIARARDAAAITAGQTATTSGGLSMAFTPAYGAPEQWAPKRFGKTGPWTDVWGLAVTVVEALAGREIIAGDHVAMMGTVLDEKRRPTPRSEGVFVPDVVEGVFRRALAVDPRERFRDVGVFWDELEQALGLPRSAPPIALPGRSQAPPAARGPAAAPRAARALDVPAPAPRASRPPPAEMATQEIDLPERRGPLPPYSLPTEPVVPLALDWSAPAPALGARSPYAPSRMPPPMVARAPTPPSPRDLMAMFALPVRLAGAGVLITIVDLGAASLLFDGERLGIGPFRLLYVAVGLVVLGIAIAVFRLFSWDR
ncbi:protein kinase [Sorangium cellulosum]|uniref:Protein kinase n=1 Tax=Sorangium cellulosum TaxID=56 RepID=A0A2L0ETX5_SORCE|nr:serine/threonine-protein kinase [Sorangium cellulosum]AUX42732.1 protein kinase [Sorangium cellulosum]